MGFDATCYFSGILKLRSQKAVQSENDLHVHLLQHPLPPYTQFYPKPGVEGKQSIQFIHVFITYALTFEPDRSYILFFIQNPNGGPNQGPCNTRVRMTPSYQRTSRTLRTVSNSTDRRGGWRERQGMPGYESRTLSSQDLSSTDPKCARVQRSFPTFPNTYLTRSKAGKRKESLEAPRLKCRGAR